MVFANLFFLYLFLPLNLILYFGTKNRAFRNAVLIFFSLFFYAWGEPVYVFLMAASITFAWGFALLMDRAKKSQSDLKNEEYLYGLIKDTPVKDRLIKEYISAVKSTAPDSVLIGGTGSIALTPPMRPKTLAEAKALAEKIIKIK